MFKIKSEQIRLFQPEAEEAFVARVAEYIRENHADALVRLPDAAATKTAALPDEIFRALVRGGVKRGRAYGIELKSTLISFVVLLFIVAPNFDRHPTARKFFKETEPIDDEAFQALLDEMTDADWEEIEKRYAPRTWELPVAEGVNA